jgi:SpoVK/Ycf46/Vps4 family AAA+-type ATPase
VGDRVLSQLLQEVDGLEPLKQVVVVAATNRPDMLDPALLRPGRLDRLLYVGPPDAEARRAILDIHTRGTPLAADVDLSTLAGARTDGFSGAEVASLCREASLAALEDDMSASHVAHRHFERAAESVRPQITRAMIEFYEGFARARGR